LRPICYKSKTFLSYHNFDNNHRPATPFLRFSVADPTDLTFSQLKKEILRGKIQKICKSQGWRGGSVFGWQTAGFSSTLRTKIGSSEIVERYQNGTKLEIVARKGGFFFGGTECRPYVPGGKCSWGSRWLRLFGF